MKFFTFRRAREAKYAHGENGMDEIAMEHGNIVYGIIDILRQQIFGPFLSHPLTMSVQIQCGHF